jgi:ribosome-binding protein aMBF1 (putative translation factor)
MTTPDAMVTAWQEAPAFRHAYEALAEEFGLFDALKARTKAGLTQAEVAERMGTKTPAVARLEAGGAARNIPPPSPRCRSTRAL